MKHPLPLLTNAIYSARMYTGPTLFQLNGLDTHLRRSVGPADIDLNGHMNAAHLFVAQTSAVRQSLAEVGVTETYVAERALGTFAVEHHVRYLAELRVGDGYSVHVRFLSRSAKAMHAASYLVNETDQRLSNVLEVVVVHVDQRTRRATEIPSDVAASVDARIVAGQALGWTHESRLALRG
jgi:acyl-CoA thioester hydrolase